MNESEKNTAERDESRMVKGFLVLLLAQLLKTDSPRAKNTPRLRCPL